MDEQERKERIGFLMADLATLKAEWAAAEAITDYATCIEIDREINATRGWIRQLEL